MSTTTKTTIKTVLKTKKIGEAAASPFSLIKLNTMKTKKQHDGLTAYHVPDISSPQSLSTEIATVRLALKIVPE